MAKRRAASLCVLGVMSVAATLPTPATAAAPTTITVAAHYNSKQVKPLLNCFRTYEAGHPGTRIKYQQASYSDFLQTILTSRASRSSADIYNIYSVWAPQLISAGALDPPPPDVVSFVKSGYDTAAVDAATLNGRLYGIPTALSIYQLVYNKKLLAAAGFRTPPKTWKDVRRVGAAVTRTNRQGNILIGGFAFGPSAANVVHVFYSQMYAAGVPPYAPDLRSTNLKSRAAVQILRQQAELFKDHITSNSISVRDFAAGAVGMAVMANWQKDTLRSAFGDAFEDTVGVAPIPTDGPGGTMFYSFFWSVDSGSRVKRQSWDLLKWLNTAQTAGGLSCTGQMLAGMGDLTGNTRDLAGMERSLADPFSQRYLAALKSRGATTQPNLWRQAEADRVLQYYIERAWAGTMTPAAALTAADARIQAILDEQPATKGSRSTSRNLKVGAAE